MEIVSPHPVGLLPEAVRFWQGRARLPPARWTTGPCNESRPADMLRVTRSIALALCFAAAAFGVAGCATHYIPNTDVFDSDENRKVVAFCETYRHAVELKDVVQLLRMASPRYYEDGGNIDASDDIDYAGLKQYLESKFQEASSIRYEIRYRRVAREGDRIFVDYTYTSSYRLPGDKGTDVWRRKVEDNRLELEAFQDEYRIVSGM